MKASAVKVPVNSRPPFKADVVGSLLRPEAIRAARGRFDKGEIGREELWAIETACVEEAVKLQRDAGLRVCTDGEFHRRHWFVDFIEKIEGVEFVGGLPTRFRNEEGEVEFSPPRLEVNGRLGRSRPLSVQDFRDLRPIADRLELAAKQAIPSPSCLHFRGGRAAIDASVYPDVEEFFEDLSQVYREEIQALYESGCRYIQIDDTNLPFLCDPKLRDHVRSIGEDPDTLPELYARITNDILRGKPDDLVVCMHMCRGNHESSWVAEGGYDRVAEIVFGSIDVDGFFLEYDSPRAGGFEPLRFLNKNKIGVLGLVTSKKPQLESKDDLKRRIDEASKYVPIERLAISPQCGFASTLRGNRLTVDDQRNKLELIVEVAHEVWGSA